MGYGRTWINSAERILTKRHKGWMRQPAGPFVPRGPFAHGAGQCHANRLSHR